MECNALKGERRAEDFVRRLYREGRLTGAELSGRLRALGRLTSGKLRVRHTNALCATRFDCSALNRVKVYNSSVKSHTFRAPQGRRFLCRKTCIPPTNYKDTSVAKFVESFAALE
jgi:hypothetical protein